MFILGLTGSIGMGKTTTARLFAEEGVPVHDADAVVHKLYDGEAAPLIEAAFPGTTREGRVDRETLGRRVVGDAAALKRLEDIVHPLVLNAETKFLADAKARGVKAVVLDIPLLFETGGDRRVDAVVVVTAPEHVQRQRVMERPGMTAEKMETLIGKQMRDADKRRRADFIVDSGQGLDHARMQVRQILTSIANMSER
jgi:dephospho-CoA kinase